MAGNEMDRVVPLNRLDDFKVAEGDPDVRGWEVIGADGARLGEVDEMLVDTAAMKVRYLDVDVEEALIAGDADRHVLIPIGYARLDRDGDRVIVDALESTRMSTLPAYGHEPVTRDFETSVRDSFAATPATTERTDDFYAHDAFDENRFYGREGENRLTLSEEELELRKRRMNAGAVEVDKRVETEHVRESIPTRHEEAVIERRPLSGMEAASARPTISDEEVRIPLTEEEVEVTKRTVPKEELVVRKREVIENETVEADLRKERAEVHREGNVDVRDDMRADGIRDRDDRTL